MALHKSLTTVTPLSKALAMILFVALPFFGFYAGTQYQELIGFQNEQVANTNPSAINHPAPANNPTTANEYQNKSIDTANWKTYSNKEIGFSVEYPPDWTEEKFTDGTSNGLNLKGLQGNTHIAWGTGFGGGCPQGYEKIQIQEEQLSTCHYLNNDGSEVWGHLSKQLTTVTFYATATANAPHENNRATILKIISTFRFN